MSTEPNDPLYLGDAVYAQNDGYMIGLSLSDHRNPPVIWLEPRVLEALFLYAKSRELIK